MGEQKISKSLYVTENGECLIYEMLFNKDKKPQLNTRHDSIKAKLFAKLTPSTFHILLLFNDMQQDFHTNLYYTKNSQESDLSYTNLKMMSKSSKRAFETIIANFYS